jgi:hypothetical protein
LLLDNLDFVEPAYSSELTVVEDLDLLLLVQQVLLLVLHRLQVRPLELLVEA